jgi:hypothetical protein
MSLTEFLTNSFHLGTLFLSGFVCTWVDSVWNSTLFTTVHIAIELSSYRLVYTPEELKHRIVVYVKSRVQLEQTNFANRRERSCYRLFH